MNNCPTVPPAVSSPEQTLPLATDNDLRLALTAYRTEATEGVLRTKRYRMNYFVWGAGPPLVFVHGMSDRAKAFVMVMHQLVARHTCIAYELPDGLTDGSDLRRYRHDDYVSDLIELLDHLKLPRAALVGSSFGSTITLSALASEPGRFAHGVLQGGFAYRPLTFAQRSLCRSARHWPGWFADWPGLYQRIMRWSINPTLSVVPPSINDFLLANGGRTPIRAAAIRTQMIDRIDLRPKLSQIQAPLLLIGGDQDPLVPFWCEEAILKGARASTRIEFIGCGHYPHYTHPRPMADAIRNFLQENPESEQPESPGPHSPFALR
jgi:pimeloyl-ACP methyl ester carboxylesterase